MVFICWLGLATPFWWGDKEKGMLKQLVRQLMEGSFHGQIHHDFRGMIMTKTQPVEVLNCDQFGRYMELWREQTVRTAIEKVHLVHGMHANARLLVEDGKQAWFHQIQLVKEGGVWMLLEDTIVALH